MRLGVKTVIGVDPGVKYLVTWVLVPDTGVPALVRQYPGGGEVQVLTEYFQGRDSTSSQDAAEAMDRLWQRYHQIAVEVAGFAARWKSQVCVDWSGDSFISTLPSLGDVLLGRDMLDDLRRARPLAGSVYRFFPLKFFVDDLRMELRNRGLPEAIVEPQSSRVCAVCLKKDMVVREGSYFYCRRCRYEQDADVNAAHVMAMWGWETVLTREELLDVLSAALALIPLKAEIGPSPASPALGV